MTKRSTLVAAVLAGICSVIWWVKTFCEVVFAVNPPIPYLLALDIVCAVLWVVVLVVQILRYKKFCKEEEE